MQYSSNPTQCQTWHHPQRDSFYGKGCLLELPGLCGLHLVVSHPDTYAIRQGNSKPQITKIAPRILCWEMAKG